MHGLFYGLFYGVDDSKAYADVKDTYDSTKPNKKYECVGHYQNVSV